MALIRVHRQLWCAEKFLSKFTECVAEPQVKVYLVLSLFLEVILNLLGFVKYLAVENLARRSLIFEYIEIVTALSSPLRAEIVSTELVVFAAGKEATILYK